MALACWLKLPEASIKEGAPPHVQTRGAFLDFLKAGWLYL
jgi:hypothetical protein